MAKTTKALLPEANKRAGVRYAITNDGTELPVVDVTHPAFALNITEDGRRELVEKFLQDGIPLGSLPNPIRTVILRFLLRGSTLAAGLGQARGGYLSGLNTYLLKIGPEMLGDAYAKPIDRRIASALPALGVRLRTQDMAYLMAGSLKASLIAEPRRPLFFLNIAGGPAIDSLNALIVLNKDQPGILASRDVSILSLDLDDAGPAFGKAALEALVDEEGPLGGIRIDFQHQHYDWNRPDDLKPVLQSARARGAFVVCSSEGGLFEYGNDDQITANLRILREYPEVQAVVGSVTRADEASRRLHKSSSAALIPRGLDVFRDLAQKAGWKVSRVIEGPFSDQVVLAVV